jgi:hypothetical protein
MRTLPQQNYSDKRLNILAPAIGLMFFVLIVAFLFLAIDGGYETNFQHSNLLPWIALTAIAIIVPNLILYYQGNFNFYNPIVFASATYFFPAFVLGGFCLAAGWSTPYFIVLIQDFYTDVSLSLIYVAVGFFSMSIGFLLPLGRIIGDWLKVKLPNLQWDNEKVIFPTFLLMFIGIANSFFAFTFGLIGFQRVAEIAQYDGLIYIFTMFSGLSFFLLWLAVFRSEKLSFNMWAVTIFLTLMTLGKAILAGNRGSLLSSFFMVGLAFAFSGKRLSINQKLIAFILLVVFVLGGMIYGTTFRGMKETEEQSKIEDYLVNIERTFNSLVSQDLVKVLEFGGYALAERLDAVSPLAVVVSNYERLAPYEESYGLDNNISKDLITFFIPRIFWEDKPVASEPRKYGDLYFSFGENSFTVTPIGDLLRNYGEIGIVVGMLIFGILLRIIQASLVENQSFSMWRVTFYFMLLTSINYEGFYGGILPFLVKVGVVTIIGLIIINFIIKKNKKNNVRI